MITTSFPLHPIFTPQDRHGFHASVVSLANPWVDFLPPRDALRVAAEVNDELQKMSELSHGRIFGFGAVAAHAAREDGGEGAKAVVRELERVASMQGMRGIILGAHELVSSGSTEFLPFLSNK